MKHFLSISCLILTTILKYHHYFHFNRVTETQRCKILYLAQGHSANDQEIPGSPEDSLLGMQGLERGPSI